MLKRSFRAILISCLVLTISLLAACGNNNDKTAKGNKHVKNPIATITVKDYGVIKAELYPKIAPNTVDNFISLANKGFYNGLTFHRVVRDFVIQGGDPEGTGNGGPGYTIKGEFTSNGFKNNLKHTTGVLSMARTGEPNSAGSQFFIMANDTPDLDGQYASFGKVIEGIDIVKKIDEVEVDSMEKPVTPVVIESIKIDTKGEKYSKPKTQKE
ncbi:peptidylprolyl isomerase [Bacillus sp. AFS017336]|uniref:peptidylprolyl isomerase n=1 Tax=Bacillus sp. AFS017336 TaxID=2033489 RepID=UPI000BF22300|nr:peptidylprolyl isomerase [Bacillus sp. AFS017336]PEL11284.1 peptidylprolyl isomerase [Bacillus sp. AFS017336]